MGKTCAIRTQDNLRSPQFHFFQSLVAFLTILVFSKANLLAATTAANSASHSIPRIESINLVDLNKASVGFPLLKPTVFVFLSSMCPCSMSHIEELKNITDDFSQIQMVGVSSNLDETDAAAHEYFKNTGLKFVVLKDVESKLANYFKASKTPHAFLLNTDGKVLFQGGVSNSSKFEQADRRYLREALVDVISGKPVRTPFARALGCAIRR
jgi:hypothetical protein